MARDGYVGVWGCCARPVVQRSRSAMVGMGVGDVIHRCLHWTDTQCHQNFPGIPPVMDNIYTVIPRCVYNMNYTLQTCMAMK